jgi:hypothetical protein
VVQSNADTRSSKESVGAKTQAIFENMSGLRSTECGNSNQMQKVSRQEPALEETRNSEVNSIFLREHCSTSQC